MSKYTPKTALMRSIAHGSQYKIVKLPVPCAIVGNNADLFEQVEKLYIKETDVIADVTYGRGTFWKNTKVKPTFAHDLALDGIDCRDLPHEDSSLDVIVFDPPYRPLHGSNIGICTEFSRRYGLSKSINDINEMIALYTLGIKEAYRVVKTNGIIMVKCQDISYSGRLHLVSWDIISIMCNVGFYFIDQFILVSKSTPPVSGKTQKRARRNYSVLWVGMKR